MRVAARRFLVRFVLRDTLIAIAIVGIGFALWLLFDFDWKYPLGWTILGLVLLVIVFGAGLRYVRISAKKFRMLKDPTVVWRFSEETVAARGEQVSMEIRWELINQLWRFPEVWLLIFDGGGYSLLPTAALGSSVQDFIVTQLRARGRRIA